MKIQERLQQVEGQLVEVFHTQGCVNQSFFWCGKNKKIVCNKTHYSFVQNKSTLFWDGVKNFQWERIDILYVCDTL